MMDFSEALFLLKAGKRVRRASWSNFFLFISLRSQSKSDGVLIMTIDSGLESEFPVNNDMILAEDWQEVKGEKE